MDDPDANSGLYWAEKAKANGDDKAQLLIDEIRASAGK
jgi:hypothetical protein